MSYAFHLSELLPRATAIGESQMSEYRPDLVKSPGRFFVVADDENYRRDDPLPYREILEVVRASNNKEESGLQWEELRKVVDDNQSPLYLLKFTARSHGHAAGLARRAHSIIRYSMLRDG
ncbi:hypothetical protein AB0H73_06340 [Streptomyces olivoreticuli]